MRIDSINNFSKNSWESDDERNKGNPFVCLAHCAKKFLTKLFSKLLTDKVNDYRVVHKS